MNNFAISSGGIGEALERSASSLMAANNTIDESIALITAANTVVQDPAAVGTAFKTISMRIRGAKTELEEAGLETDGMVESTAKLRSEILALTGVDIMDGANQFKSTYAIMDELATKWQDLTDIQQATVTELIAGKRQGNIVSSLMTNFDTARDALETSLNSSGSAMKEHEKWQQSLEARINSLKASWQALSQSFLKSNFLKTTLNAVIGLVDGLTKLVDTLGTIPSLLTVFGGFKIIKTIFSVISKGGGLSSLGGVLGLLQKAFPSVTDGVKKLVTSLREVSLASGGAGSAFHGFLSLIMQHPVIALAAIAVTALTTVLIAQKKKAEELAKEVEELTEKYKEEHKALKDLESDFDTDNKSSMINKYAKLSKGVDNLGRNVSLTTEEYSEYQDIVNSIAEQIPSLVSGYDEQGNALLSCKGNVEELTAAYEKLIHAQNNEIFTNSGDIEKDFANTLKKASGEGIWSNGHGFWAGLLNKSNRRYWGNYELKTDTVEGIESLLNANSKSERNDIKKKLSSDAFSEAEIRTALESAGVEVKWWQAPIDVLEDTLEKDPIKVKGIIDDYYAQFADAIEKQKTIAQAKLSEAFDISSAISGLNYGDIGEDLQAIANQTVANLDLDFFTKLQEQGKTVDQWTKEMLDQLNAVGQVYGDEIESVFELQTKFNSGDIAYGEYVKELKEFDTILDSLNLKSEVKDQIKISVGLDEGGIVEQYNALVNRLTSDNYDFDIGKKEAQAWLSSLSSEDLSLAVEIITETSNNGVSETIGQLQAMLDKEKAVLGLSLEVKYEDEKAKLDALATALSESASGSGLSTESLSAIADIFGEISGYNPAKLFERTANGIRLNATEFRKLNNEYKKKNVKELNENMDTLGDAYIQTRDELSNLAYGTDEYNDKLRDLNAIEDQINAVEQLTAGYEGLASAYQEWQMIESAGSQRDMYEGIIEGFENIGDEISRGWYDDGTIEFLELLTGKDLSTANLDEIKKTYKDLGKEIKNTTYSVKDFFTVDKDGNSTSTGVYNFLDAVGQLEEEAFGGKDVVQRDKNGKIIAFDFQIAGGDKAIADALGISEELVQIMKRAADDAGFVVSMDGTYQQLDVLVKKAKEAAAKLKDTFKATNYNFFQDSSDNGVIKDYEEALKLWDKFKKNKNSDGSVNMSVNGAQEAYTLVSTLQSMVDQLNEPVYMQLNTDDVEKGLRTPLEKLQQYQTLVETEHQLNLKGTDTSQLQEDKKEILDYFEEIQKNSPEIAASLGIKGDSRAEIEKKLQEGTIEIPAVVDLQVEMNETLKDMVNVAFYNAGLIDKNELEARVNVSVYAEDVDTSDVQEKVQDSVEGDGFWAPIKTWWKNLWTKDETEKAEVTIREAEELLQKLEDKDITVDVTVKGIKDIQTLNKEVDKLNKDIDLTTQIKGNVDKLSEYVEGAKALSELDDNIESLVFANVSGNITETAEFKINNLKVFGESAKEIKDLGSFESNVTANVYGNVIDTKERKIDNLKVFTDSAKDIESIGNVESKVTAEVQGDVTETAEFKLNNLKVFSDSAKDIESIGNVESIVTAEVKGDVVETAEYKLDNLKKFTDSAQDIKNIDSKEVVINAEVKGDVTETAEFKLNNLKAFTDSAKDIKNINSKEVTITAEVDGDVTKTAEFKLNNLKVFTDSAENIKDIDSKKVTIEANVKGNVTDNKTESKINNLKVFTDSAENIKNIDSKSITIEANVEGNITDTFGKTEGKIDNLKVFTDSAKDIKDIDSKEVTITADVEGSVFTTKEKSIDNLNVFAEGAKTIQSLDDNISTTVTAKINSGEDSAINEWEYKLNNLEVFAKGAKELQNVGNVSTTVNAQVEGNAIGKFEANLNDLEVFAEGAKALQNIGDVSSTVKAKIDTEGGGDVINRFEGQLNNLKVFADGAKEVKSIGGDVSSTVTARINTKVGESDATDIGMFESRLNNLNVFADGVKAVKEVEGEVSSTVTARINTKVGESDATDIGMFEGRINNLKVFADSAKALQGVGDVSTTVTAKIATGKGIDAINRTDGEINRIKTFASAAKELKGVGNPSTTVTANADGNIVSGDGASDRISLLSRFKSLIQGMSTQTVTVSVKADVDSENVQKAIDILTDVKDSGVFKNYKAEVKVGAKVTTIDDSKVSNYKVPKKDGKVSYSVDPESSVYTWTAPSKEGVVNYSAEVEALTKSQKNKTGTITYTPKIKGGLGGLFGVVNGTANANGVAHANGTAFKQGDWGVKKTTTALTGELGQELVVYKNRWYTVGDNGAEFATIPKGAIVFNHKQTEELFKNGKVTSDGGRGRVFANGTAFAQGTAFEGGSNGDGVTAQKETIDWVEVLFARFEKAIDKFEQGANNIYQGWDDRKTNLVQAMKETLWASRTADNAAKFYSGEVAKAESNLLLGFGQKGREAVEAVQNGKLKIDEFDTEKDKDLLEAIKNYQELYNKQQDTTEEAVKLREEWAKLNKQRFDSVIEEYDGILQGFEHTDAMINEYIAQSEAQGHIVSKNYYKELYANEEAKIDTLTEKQYDLIQARDNAVATGAITEGSQAWYDMCKEIDGVTQAIEEGETALIEYDNAMRDIDWQVSDLIQERISDVTAEADFLIDLMSNDKLHNDDGSLTDKGMATMGLHGQNYNTYMYAADEYANEIAKLDTQIAQEPYDQELINRRRQLIGLQRESILAAEDEKQAIKDLVEEGINLELDALQERIDLHNEELDSMRDLYDYQKNVQEQTKNIASLQKQLQAYEGFDDEETRATVQKLKVELESAQQDLQETEYDKYIADQTALLDELFLEYENVLNTRIDDVDGLMSQVVGGINAAFGDEGTITSALGEDGAIAKALATNATSIGSTLKNEAEAVGTKLSTAMDNIWKADGSGKTVLDLYGKDYQNKHTATNDALNNIKANIAAMVDDVDKEAKKKVEQPKTQPSSKADPTGGSSGGGSKGNGSSSGGNKSTGGDGKVKIGDKVKFLSGKYYYDSQGVNPAGSKNHGKYVYITNVNNEKWATHPIHISTGKKLGSGDLGWLKKHQISGYATGKKNFLDDEIAWTQENGREFIVRPSDGAILTPIAKKDSVLNAQASSNIWDMANSPAEFIKDNLKLDATNVPNSSNTQSSYTQILDKVVFNLPNVKNYDELLSALKDDKNFDRLIKSMTIDQIAGKSGLAKGKSIR